MTLNHSNYLGGDNPFNLAGPPEWWLTKLHDFDESLVVVPSKQGFYYRLAQRRPLDPRVKIVHSISSDSDSKMLAAHGLVPVTTILATARWDNPVMWEDLRQRSPHRMGGAAAYEAMLAEQERKRDLNIAAQNDQVLTDVGRDAWRYYLLKAGRRTAMWSPTTKREDKLPAQRSAMIRVLGPDGKPTQTRL